LPIIRRSSRRLNQEIDCLKNQKAPLADSEDPEAKNQIKEIDRQISAKEKELQALLSDPWLKRLQSAREDAESRRYDFKTAQNKTLESLENEFAFQERFLSAKVSQLKKEGPDSAELASTKEELKAKRVEYQQALAELDGKAKNFSGAEQSRLDKEIAAIKEERRKIRLVFLQTDTPYKNTNVNMVVRNGGTPMTFVSEGYPLPTTFSVAVGYAFVNTVLHNAKLTAQLNVPFYDAISLGFGAEYVFGNLVYVRGGYTFGAVDRSFSTGAGVRLALGFTEVSVDYTFRPLPDYGLLHSIGVALQRPGAQEEDALTDLIELSLGYGFGFPSVSGLWLDTGRGGITKGVITDDLIHRVFIQRKLAERIFLDLDYDSDRQGGLFQGQNVYSLQYQGLEYVKRRFFFLPDSDIDEDSLLLFRSSEVPADRSIDGKEFTLLVRGRDYRFDNTIGWIYLNRALYDEEELPFAPPYSPPDPDNPFDPSNPIYGGTEDPEADVSVNTLVFTYTVGVIGPASDIEIAYRYAPLARGNQELLLALGLDYELEWLQLRNLTTFTYPLEPLPKSKVWLLR